LWGLVKDAILWKWPSFSVEEAKSFDEGLSLSWGEAKSFDESFMTGRKGLRGLPAGSSEVREEPFPGKKSQRQTFVRDRGDGGAGLHGRGGRMLH
jgi:hypothetical protein